MPKEKDSLRWTVDYHTNDARIFSRHDVLFYEIQDAIMDLSREAYEKETSCLAIQIH